MYYPYFITYILIGFGLSLALFLWALNSGQFGEQQRARFLPLEKETPPKPKQSRISRREIYVILILALIGLATSGVVLVFAFFSSG